MKTAMIFLLFSSIAWATKPVQPNFFQVDTNTSELRPDKEIAIKHFADRIEKKEAQKPSIKTGMSAVERIENTRVGPGL